MSATDPASRHIVVMGLMGSGKTTVGRLLAARTGRPFVDNDARLVAQTGRDAAHTEHADGRELLHRLEATILLQDLDRTEPAVIAAAASAILDEGVRVALRRCAFVAWLRTPPAELARRVQGDASRPLDGDVLSMLERQDAERGARYAEAADIVVDGDADPREAVDAIVVAYGLHVS